MLKIYIILILLFSINFLYGQDHYQDYEEAGSSIKWDDPIYNDFFINQCPVSKRKSAMTLRTFTKLYASDYPDSHYGTANCKCQDFVQYGCNITCQAMMLTNSGDNVSPIDLNTWYSANGGFGTSGCGVNRGAVSTRTNKTVKYDNYESGDSPNYARFKTVLDNQGFIMAFVELVDSWKVKHPCAHWILIYGWENVGGVDVFYTADPDRGSDGRNGDLSKYNVCKTDNTAFRYYILESNSQVQGIEKDGVAVKTETKVKKGTTALFRRGAGASGSWRKSTQSNTSACTKKLWVIKDSNGNVIDSYADDDYYTFTPQATGTYYISFAINSENGFDGESIKVVVEDNTNGGGPIGGGGSCDICATSKFHTKSCPGYWDCWTCSSCYCSHDIQEGFTVDGQNSTINFICSNSNVLIKPVNQNCDANYFNFDETSITYRYDIFNSIWESSDIGQFIGTEKSDWFVANNRYSLGVRTGIKFLIGEPLNSTLYKLKVAGKVNKNWHESTQYIYFMKNSFTSSDIKTSQKYYAAINDITIENKTLTNKVCKAGSSITFLPNTIIDGNSIAEIDPDFLNLDCSTTKSGVSDTSIYQLATDIDKSTLLNNISIYPNPNNGNFNISVTSNVNYSVQVFNSSGLLIYSQNNNNHLSEIDIKESPTGIYFVKIITDTGTTIRKVIKE